ncbi:hypothetical protein BDV33DRAFT_210386 [Aspergillus novoparasiticus]|uniref:Uncharacterized protein n=1 Tax=Aspergillus novoparasiticus TaxID=986946 RepID=A0A5N6E8X6_9EURO|nr:hypothetical protein BDV33DRAFT_210386 [Aspergillus novoparasiticus]
MFGRNTSSYYNNGLQHFIKHPHIMHSFAAPYIGQIATTQIICATLSKVYSFKDRFSPIWLFWYIREASTAICVANIPNCWSLARHILNLRSWTGSPHSKDRTHHCTPYGYETGTYRRTIGPTASRKKSLWTSVTMSGVQKTESAEEIINANSEQANQEIPLESGITPVSMSQRDS